MHRFQQIQSIWENALIARMYLLDTNIVSEIRKGSKAHPGVLAFWASVEQDAVFLPAQVLGELRAGVEAIRRRGDISQANLLESWVQKVWIEFSSRILPFDADSALVWGTLLTVNDPASVDKQIAAVGLIYRLTVVTRNVGDFSGTGVALLNPFAEVAGTAPLAMRPKAHRN